MLKSVAFLGHVVNKYGIMVSPTKIDAIYAWARATSLIEFHNFIGLVVYYRRFVKKFATILAPITRLTRKEVLFSSLWV